MNHEKLDGNTMNRHRLEVLAETLRSSGVPSHFGEAKSRLLIKVWRAILEGRPVPPQRIRDFARQLFMSAEDATSFIHQISEQDARGEVVGIFGLSQLKHPHKFFLNDRMFYTWCAWDALFLPPMLKQCARVESTCPQTGLTVTVGLTPSGVSSCSPATAAFSIVVPEISNSDIISFERVWSSFCCNVHFFRSSSAACAWTSGKKRTFQILSVDEGFQLGLLAFREMLECS